MVWCGAVWCGVVWSFDPATVVAKQSAFGVFVVVDSIEGVGDGSSLYFRKLLATATSLDGWPNQPMVGNHVVLYLKIQ